jgi:hypothetical protein
MTKKQRETFFSAQKIFIFSGISTLFVALAAKIAFVRQFPLPYDEGFHFGLIRLYAHHLNPFLASQPAGADGLGAVARDSSYLYHYLMSFPYRFIALFAHSEIVQVWILRGLNILLGLVTLGLVYRLARRCGLSVLGSQLVILALAITPVFYDLAGSINYDNLLVPLTLTSLLLTLSIRDRLKRGEMPVSATVGLGSLLLVTSLVKYTFLPLMVGIALYVAFITLRQMRGRSMTLLGQHVRQLAYGRQFLLIVCLLLSSVLWAQRYGVNMVSYHTPHPQCDAVLSVAACEQYAPWARNYQLHQTRAARPMPASSALYFTFSWVRSMYIQLFSIVSYRPDGSVLYTTQTTLRYIARTLVLCGVIAAIFTWQILARQRSRWGLFATVAGLYLLSLYVQNLSDFRNLHAMVAIQGRYLLPILPLVYIAVAAASSLVIEDFRHLVRLTFRQGLRLRYLAALSHYRPFGQGPRTFP